MASLIPGYEYDIFISYRQKDNKHDGWVTEFVNNLKGEIEATFKEDISVYFDENPHDRLQDSHNVNKSLEGKLKCLLFIPILSQTYCDPASYAWQNEFLAFIKMAGHDQFGMDVKLKGGNVAGRVLPVRIHDLDPDDIKLFEKETGGKLRSIDFVFRTSAGVNRPLMASEDHPNDNLNKIYYRDQVNKVAHAIKEILQGLKTIVAGQEERADKEEVRGEIPYGEQINIQQGKNKPSSKFKVAGGIFLSAVIICLLVVIFYPAILKQDKKATRDQDGRISLVVNNFNNNSGDTSLNNLRIAIPDIIRNDLSNMREQLLVQNSQAMFELYESMGQNNKASLMPSVSKEVAQKFGAGSYLTGSLQSIKDTILLLAELNDTKSGEVIWSDRVKGAVDNYQNISLRLSEKLKDFLEIKALGKDANPDFAESYTGSPEAYRKYLEGITLWMNGNSATAILSLQDAYAIDTTFSLAAFYTAFIYNYDLEDFVSSVKWTGKAYTSREKLPYEYRIWIEMWYACYFTKDLDEIIKYCNLLELTDIKSRYFWLDLAVTYTDSWEYESALKSFKMLEKISGDWGMSLKKSFYYSRYGWTLHNLGLHEQEEKAYEQGLQVFPDDPRILYQQGICAITRGDQPKAEAIMTKMIKWAKENKWTDGFIESVAGDIYVYARLYDEAEKHYRKALELENSLGRKSSLANFLVRFTKNIEEADSLSKEVLAINPKAPNALWTQALVCYHRGRYEEALDLMFRSQAPDLSWNTDKQLDIRMIRKAMPAKK